MSQFSGLFAQQFRRNVQRMAAGKYNTSAFTTQSRSFSVLSTFNKDLTHPQKMAKLPIPAEYQALLPKPIPQGTQWPQFLDAYVANKDNVIATLQRLDSHRVRFGSISLLAAGIGDNLKSFIHGLNIPADTEDAKLLKTYDDISEIARVVGAVQRRFRYESNNAHNATIKTHTTDDDINESLLGINEYFRMVEDANEEPQVSKTVGKPLFTFNLPEKFYMNRIQKLNQKNAQSGLVYLTHFDSRKDLADEAEAVLNELQAVAGTLSDYKKHAKEKNMDPEKYLEEAIAKMTELQKRLE